jgi:type I restriction enzyme S subunit
MDWMTKPLGEALTFQRGFDITKAQQRSGCYWVISSSGPNSQHDEFKVKGPGVIIGRKGSLGTVFYSEQHYWPHDTTLWVKDFHGNDARFVYYFLKTMRFAEMDVGAANPTLNRNHIHLIPVRWPQRISTQRRIASILSAYDDLIENNTRRIAILEEMARRIYEEWFVHFRFPGHEQVRMVESELGLIPEGWSIERVGNVLLRRASGTTYKKEQVHENGDVIVVDQSVLDFLGFHTAAPDHLASVNQPIAIFGDHTCKLKLMLQPFSVGPNTIPFEGVKGLDTIYTFQLVQGLVSTHEYKRHWTEFADKKVIRAAAKIATAYGDVVRGMLQLVLLLTQKNLNLRTTRDLLLPKLISGELDVSHLPEPEAMAA